MYIYIPICESFDHIIVRQKFRRKEKKKKINSHAQYTISYQLNLIVNNFMSFRLILFHVKNILHVEPIRENSFISLPALVRHS